APDACQDGSGMRGDCLTSCWPPRVCDHNAPMNKRARVMAALRGEPVDRVPLSFWLHNFTAENAVDSFVAESLRLARELDWDYLKPQSRAQCFAEAWG